MSAHWNYRVVKTVGVYRGAPYAVYAVHEVYYRDGVAESLTTRRVVPAGPSPEELLHDWAAYRRAFDLPGLVYDPAAGAFTGEEAWPKCPTSSSS